MKFGILRKTKTLGTSKDWKEVTTDELRRIQGKDITMVFNDGKVVGKIKSNSEIFLHLDGFSFYTSAQIQPGFAEISRIYPIDLKGVDKQDRASGLSILKNSEREYTLRGKFFGWFYHTDNPEIEGFMLQSSLDLGYS